MQTAAKPFKLPGAVVRKVAWILAAIIVSVLTLVLARQFLLALPADHFCRSESRKPSGPRQLIQRVGGALLVLVGAVLAIPGVPGQGLLMILIGLMLLDLPFLRRLELRLLRVPLVAQAVNALRSQGGKPPLELPKPPDA